MRNGFLLMLFSSDMEVRVLKYSHTVYSGLKSGPPL